MNKLSHFGRLAFISAMAAGFAVLVPAGAPSATGEPRKPTPFATGGPDSFGYRFIDSQEAGGPVFNSVWEDISASGTTVFGPNVDDSVSSAVSIGFTFPFYGNNYTSLYVSSNGNIHFSNPSATYPGTNMPGSGSPNDMIAGFWADCHTGPDGYIRSSSNATRCIIQWSSCEYYPSNNGEDFNYEIKLYPSGVIYIAYQSMSNNGSTNSTAIGIENSSGSVGLQYCFNGSPNVIANNRVILFANNQPPAPPTNLVQAATAGGSPEALGFVSDPTVYFRGNVTDPDSGNTVGLQVEVLPNATPFSSNITGQTAVTPSASMVASGQAPECVYTFGNPYGSGDYHWRARSVDSSGSFSAWVEFNAAASNFYVDLTPPSAPSGPFFPNAIQTIGTEAVPTVTFTWGPATDGGPPGPISYNVEVSVTSAFLTTITAGSSPTTSFSAGVPASDVDYYWRVRAVDQAGNIGAWAGPMAFQVGFIEQFPKPPDKYAYCGADAPANPWGLVAAMAALAFLAASYCFWRRSIS